MKSQIFSILAGALLAGHTQAAIMSEHLLWTGEAGWQVRINFKFDDAFPVINATLEDSYTEEIPGLRSFETRFFNPDGKFLYENQVVEAGYNWYYYFEFHFDTATRKLIPGTTFNFGGEDDVSTPDHGYMLEGSSDMTESSLYFRGFEPDPDDAGLENFGLYLKDQNGIFSTPVPDGGSTAALLGIGALGLMGAKRIRRKSGTTFYN